MLENTQSLLPIAPGGQRLQVLSVGIDDESLDELARLLGTLGVDPVARLIVHTRSIHPGTYLGKGKIEEVKVQLEARGAHAVIVDVDLSPNQLKNLEEAIGKPVLDRQGVIIEIFSRHARTKESKTQVELAKLQYLLPRLMHFWTHFERQRGGIGNKGMGEKQIEVDRRLVKNRMSILRGRLTEIEKERQVQRSGRRDVLKVALVGYTNAGKSTLLNALTESRVLAEDKLFATLDASVRALDPDCHPPVVAIDTVGFISRLPPGLVASFRSTLEELHQADLLLHVVDGSSPLAREQMQVTEKVLEELGVGATPRIVVLNKMDQLGDGAARIQARVIFPGAERISALSREDVRRLRDRVLSHFRQNLEVYELLVPFAESRMHAMIHAHGSVEVSREVEKGMFYRVRMDGEWAGKLGLKRFVLGA
ncbi:MAG: GTPase HflX [Oligoflexia bacterium]|jgi:GTP-binding protein HflX